MWSKVKTRLISAFVLVAILLLVVFFTPAWVFNLLVCALTFMVMYELTKVFGLSKKPSITIANYIFAALFMSLQFLNGYIASMLVVPAIVGYIMVISVISVLDNQRVKFSDVCSSAFLVFYSVVFLMYLTLIRNLGGGVALLFMALIGAYITDTGAYFTGMAIGRHKLIPSVSPNKTVEGAIGGVVFTVIGFLVYGVVVSALGYNVNYLLLVVLSVICAVVAQFGDLAASAMKRSFAVKDFGNLIPGHGGMVDRVDSLMFVAPVVYYFITFLPVVW